MLIVENQYFTQILIDCASKICYNTNNIFKLRRNLERDSRTMVKLMSKITALVLVLAFCFSMAACTKSKEPQETDGNEQTNKPEATSDGSSETEGAKDPEYVNDDLPELNFNETINILYWEDVEKLEFVPKAGGQWDMSETVQSSLYKRNDSVQSRLGVKLNFIPELGNGNNVDQYLKRVQLDFQGDREFDISAAYSRTAGKCATRGYFRDLSDNKYIDITKPWYPESLIKNITIGDSLFFVSGDASVNTLYLMYTVYFNRDLITDLSLEDPQQLVKDKKWTIDKLIEMTTDTYQNIDGDDDDTGNNNDLDDFYGFCTIYYGVDAFYTGSGYMLVDNTDKEAVLKLSADYTSEAVQNLTEKLQRWLTSKDCNVFMKSGQYRQPFVNGNALFCQERCYLPENYLIGKEGFEGVSFNYGILPTPLLDEKQDYYITCLGNPFTLYSITRACDDSEVDMLGAFIECWSSQSYRLSTPALFEVNMKLKYAKEAIDAQMFDICKKTITSDLGRVFSKDLNTMSEIWSKAACTSGNSWKTTAQVNSRILKNKINDIVNEIKDIIK